jgi:hypothetical protein
MARAQAKPLQDRVAGGLTVVSPLARLADGSKLGGNS